jgi:hypothetical protein
MSPERRWCDGVSPPKSRRRCGVRSFFPLTISECTKEQAMRFAIVLMMLAVACLAWAGNTLIAPVDPGNTTSETEWQPVKDVVAKWTQLPDLAGSAVSSEWCDDIGLITDMADDFYCEDGDPVVALEWWCTFYNCVVYAPPSPIDFFVVRFYAYTGSCTPGVALYDEAIYTWTEEYTPGGDMYSQFHYTAELPVPFLQEAGNTYWIQIQAVHIRTDYCQYGWAQCLAEDQWGCEAVLKSDYFGVPNWTALSALIGYHFEPSYVIYGETYSPVEDASWSTVKALYR